MSEKPKILCLDDEENVLEAMSAILRRRFEVVTTTGGAHALTLLKDRGPFHIVLSDMRMPEMDGAKFLARVRELAPDTVRMLLTGHADINAAVLAINEGQIFRFLTKPCPPAILDQALDAALEYYDLRSAERVLLEETLYGSIRVMLDILALTHPLAANRCNQIKKYAGGLAQELKLPHRWQLEIAAMVSQLGFLTVANDTVEKIYRGEQLNKLEKESLENVYEIPEKLLRSIPRLEGVCALLNNLSATAEMTNVPKIDRAWLTLASKILRLASAYAQLEAQGTTLTNALAMLNKQKEDYSLVVLDAFCKMLQIGADKAELKEMPLCSVAPGMTFARDVFMTTGALFVPKGFEVTRSFAFKVLNIRPGTVKEPVLVLVPPAPAT